VKELGLRAAPWEPWFPPVPPGRRSLPEEENPGSAIESEAIS